ncbi:Actin, aortic smooth muscle [Cichlidogyrus casuarinus]|uniref:Actin, aortic smooth muscle n=1 Tax=Cichlidogyrus casuarinus TaxID=1844966 RepID=A0ABD2Q2M3_9PLAT
MDSEIKATSVIVDLGSGVCKAGFGGDDAPRCTIPTLVGRPLHNQYIKLDRKSLYIGQEAQSARGILKLQYPMEKGIVRSWDDMEAFMHNLFFNELRIIPEEHTFLLSEPPLSPKSNKERMAQVMFETFNCKALHVADQSVLTLYATGRTTGLVIDCGEGLTKVVPIYEGYAMPISINKTDLAGYELTSHMMRLLSKCGYSFGSSAEREIARDLKERLCYVKKEMHNEDQAEERGYELPDGETIAIGNERYECSEMLFQPALYGVEQLGIHELVYDSINKCTVDLRRHLYSDLVLSGGSTLFPGFDERLLKEITNLAPNGMKIRMSTSPASCRKYWAWLGGSIVSALTQFQQMWVTKADYTEYGPSYMHRKCF